MSRFEGRTEKPTPRRRRKARREGQNPRSQEVGVALSLLGTLILGRIFLPGAIESIYRGTRTLLANAGSAPSGASVRAVTQSMLLAGLLPVLGMATGLGLLGGAMQNGFRLAPVALKPKLSNLSLKKGLQRFKPSTMAWEGVRSALKLGLLIAVSWGPMNALMSSVGEARGIDAWIAIVGAQIWNVLMRVTLLAVLIAAADYTYNRIKNTKQLKMTRQEVKQESKDTEGDPLLRARRRSKQAELSRNRMILDATTADVVITNPTHFAVALKYTMGEPAPRVVAKGTGRLAKKIKKLAYRHGVMVQQDPPLARAIYRRCKVGSFVPATLFEAVAVILAVAYRRRRRGVA